ncbi:MAG: TonB-dependent receptor plug domain-containing protein [Longimicrobiales bacterium]
MRRSPTVFASAIALALSASNCAPRNSAGDADTAGRSGGVVVVTGRQLLSRGGNLLDALRGRVSNMRIERQQGRCPVIALRGQKTFVGSTNPNVYIDGTRMTDTCSLDQVQLVSIDRVEIYPGGISPPAGYSPAANGVIIVFLTGPPVRRGE